MAENQPSSPSQAYGPFTDVLTGPLSGQRQQALQQPSGWGGSGAALANYANAFIKSAQVGQREKLERSEAEKAAHERNFDSVHSFIQSNPNISSEGKQAAEKLYLQGKFSQVADHASQNEKHAKDNPLFALTKAITGAVMGPGELKQHKDMRPDVNALLNIANDERFHINPQEMKAAAAADIASQLRSTSAGTPGVASVEGLPASAGRPVAVPGGEAAPQFSADAAVQYQPTNVSATPSPLPATVQVGATAPEAGTPGVDAVAGHQMTQGEALANPQIQKRLADLEKVGINWQQDPYLSTLIGGLPKTGPAKAVGTAKLVMDRMDGKRYYEQQVQNSDGTYSYIRNPTPAPEPAAPAMQHTWVKTPDGQTTVGLFNPRKPGGFIDFNNNPLPDGTKATVPPTDGSGQNATYRVMAKSLLARQGIADPTEQEITNLAGQIAMQRIEVGMSKTQQDMAVTEAQTGVGAGPGIVAPTPRPPAAGAAAPRTPVTPRTPATAPQTPQAQTSGSFATPQARNDAEFYYNTILGTDKSNGKSELREQNGRKALQAASGLTPGEFSAEVADNKATQAALSDAIKISGAFGRVQQTLQEHGQVLIDAARANGPGNVPIANQTWQWIQQHTGEYPELQKYNIALAAVQREYARLVSGGVQSKAMLPVSAQEKGEAVIRKDAPLGTIIAAVEQLKVEAATEQKAFGQQQQELKNKLANSPLNRVFQQGQQQGPGRGGATTPPPVTPPPAGMVTLTITDPKGNVTTKAVKAADEAAARKYFESHPGYSVK